MLTRSRGNSARNANSDLLEGVDWKVGQWSFLKNFWYNLKILLSWSISLLVKLDFCFQFFNNIIYTVEKVMQKLFNDNIFGNFDLYIYAESLSWILLQFIKSLPYSILPSFSFSFTSLSFLYNFQHSFRFCWSIIFTNGDIFPMKHKVNVFLAVIKCEFITVKTDVLRIIYAFIICFKTSEVFSHINIFFIFRFE